MNIPKLIFPILNNTLKTCSIYLIKRNSHLCNETYRNLRYTNVRLCEKYLNEKILINRNINSSIVYYKSKDIKKHHKGKQKVKVDEQQLSEVLDYHAFETQLQKAIDTLKEEYIKHLSLRSATGAIESLPVSLDGKDYTLQELAQIVRKNPKTIVINMVMFPQAIPAALNSIKKSGMNLNPQQDGTTLYIPIPKVTREHREQLSKNAKNLFIKCRDNIKDTQNKYTKNIKKQDTLSSDLIHNVQLQLVTIADQYISQAEKIFTSKQTELIGEKE